VDLGGGNLIHFVLVHLQLNSVGVDLEADLRDLAVQLACFGSDGLIFYFIFVFAGVTQVSCCPLCFEFSELDINCMLDPRMSADHSVEFYPGVAEKATHWLV
jgi:hypothetical protein